MRLRISETGLAEDLSAVVSVMRWSLIHILLLVMAIVGCGRREPTAVRPQADIPTLQPVATFAITPSIAEASGLCYHKTRGTLLVVSDDRPDIFEMDLTGRVLGSISTSCTDLEGVALSRGGDTIYVVQERAQLVTALTWQGTELFSFPVRVATLENHALEGVAVGDDGDLFVLNEKDPRMLLRYRGRTEVARREIQEAFDDLADICYHKDEDCLWIISDESLKVGKLSKEGALLGEWFIPFSKGEGIAVVGNNLYVVRDGEPKLYVFAKP